MQSVHLRYQVVRWIRAATRQSLSRVQQSSRSDCIGVWWKSRGVISGYGCEANKCRKHERKVNLNVMTGYPIAVPLVSVRSHVYSNYKPGDLSSDFLKNLSCSAQCSKNHTYELFYLMLKKTCLYCNHVMPSGNCMHHLL